MDNMLPVNFSDLGDAVLLLISTVLDCGSVTLAKKAGVRIPTPKESR